MQSGSLQIKGNMYYAVLSVKDIEGKRKTKWVSLKIPSTKGNKRKAEAELNRVLMMYREDKITNYNDVLFCDYLCEWLDEHKENIEITSHEAYHQILNKHVYPYFYNLGVKLTDLKPIHVHNYYRTKYGQNKVGLSGNTLKKHHALIRKCLKHATQLDLIDNNPADRVTLPKTERYQGKAYTLEESKLLLEKSKGDSLEVPIYLALLFGLRRSEILGLRWDALDFEKRTLHVRRTVTRLKTHVEREGTKNKSSNRIISIPEVARNYLTEVRSKQIRQLNEFGIEHDDNMYVCCWPDGKAYETSYISHKFGKLVVKLNLPRIRFHDLRHSAASILISQGNNIKDVSEFLGHSQTSTTLNIYAHAYKDASVALMKSYSEVLSNTK